MQCPHKTTATMVNWNENILPLFSTIVLRWPAAYWFRSLWFKNLFFNRPSPCISFQFADCPLVHQTLHYCFFKKNQIKIDCHFAVVSSFVSVASAKCQSCTNGSSKPTNKPDRILFVSFTDFAFYFCGFLPDFPTFRSSPSLATCWSRWRHSRSSWRSRPSSAWRSNTCSSTFVRVEIVVLFLFVFFDVR